MGACALTGHQHLDVSILVPRARRFLWSRGVETKDGICSLEIKPRGSGDENVTRVTMFSKTSVFIHQQEESETAFSNTSALEGVSKKSVFGDRFLCIFVNGTGQTRAKRLRFQRETSTLTQQDGRKKRTEKRFYVTKVTAVTCVFYCDLHLILLCSAFYKNVCLEVKFGGKFLK